MAVLLVLGPAASAHAWLLEAHPGPNQQLPSSPDVLFIRFTENVEREYTRAEVYDLNGTRVDRKEVNFDSARRDQILVPLQNLTDGLYTVRWYSLSVDTHTASGSYVFGVGAVSLEGAPPPTAAHVHAKGFVPEWGEAAGRAIFYASVAGALGSPVFLLAVARSPLHPNAARLHRLLFVVLVAGTLGGAVVLAAFADRIGASFGQALQSRVGLLLSARVGLVLVGLGVVGAAIVARPKTPRAASAYALALAAAGLGAILAAALSSHAAALAQRRTLAVAADAVHLAAGSVWIGGVLAFFVLRRGEPREALASWISRFSPIAVASVGLLLVTGTLASVIHLRELSGLWEGRYGAMILLKLSLLAPLLGLGAYNRYVARRRLTAGTDADPRHLQRALAWETALMAGVLLAAGVLATSAPPSVAVAADLPQSLRFEEGLETAHLVFEVAPAPVRVGIHNFTVQLHAFEVENPPGTEVFLKFAPPGHPEPEKIETLARISVDTWTLRGGFLTERGDWTIYVIVQRPDEYKKLPFEVTVA